MSRIKVCVVTGSRAEFGQLVPLLEKLSSDETFDLRLVATGSHVSGSFQTIGEIEKLGFAIDRAIQINSISNNTRQGIAKQISELLLKFTDYFTNNRPDLLIAIGDRYEMFATALSASNLLIPIAHICGGSKTVGAIDEFYRHSLTKMSQLHFVTCDAYKKRVIQLGESPKTVFNVGSLAIENCLKVKLISEDDIRAFLNLKKGDKYCLVTFHPVTLERNSVLKEMAELITALRAFDYHYIVTLSNTDSGGDLINKCWEKEAKTNDKIHIYPSLGMVRYLSALKYSEMMIGNSSSATTEGPAMKIPSIDIGDRQKGRFFCHSLIHCDCSADKIIEAIKTGSDPSFKKMVSQITNPFGDGDTSKKMVDIIKKEINRINLKKDFYDIDYDLKEVEK